MRTVGITNQVQPVAKKNLRVFKYDVRFGDAVVWTEAGVSPLREDDPDGARAVLGLIPKCGDHFAVRPVEDGRGFLVYACGKDAVEALQEAVRNLYQILVEEKVHLAELGDP